jgi:hypothetical protein
MTKFEADSAAVVETVRAAIVREMEVKGLVTVPSSILTPEQLRQARKLSVKMVA